jgi:hypothetical protein
VPSEDEVFKALADHYKDTFTHLRTYIQQRDWFFVASLVVLTAMLFQMSAPGSAEKVIAAVIGKQLGAETPIDTTFLGSVIWFLMMATVLRYFQTTVNIERQYVYIRKVEHQLAQHYEAPAFTREGDFYLDRYPRFSDWAHLLYRIVFPAVVIGVASMKLYSDLAPGWGACCLNVYLVFNALIYVFLVVSVALYLEIIRWGRTIRQALATVVAVFSTRPRSAPQEIGQPSPESVTKDVAANSVDRRLDQG